MRKGMEMGVLVIGFAMGLIAAASVALAGGAIWIAILAYLFVGVIAAPLVGLFVLLAWPKRNPSRTSHDPVHAVAS